MWKMTLKKMKSFHPVFQNLPDFSMFDKIDEAGQEGKSEVTDSNIKEPESL